MLFHFIRPGFLLAFLGLGILWWRLHRRFSPSRLTAFSWCDKPLREALLKQYAVPRLMFHPIVCILLSLAWIIFAAAGPTWKQLPHPFYQLPALPKLILLDLSDAMLAADLSPNRLQRALFAAQDLLALPNATPIGFIAYTSEPFMVSPLTEDAHTITMLLPFLKPTLPPVGGQNLQAALKEAANILHQAHFQLGALLVLTGSPPDEASRLEARALAEQGISVSILPMTQHPHMNPSFQALATAGKGSLLSLQHTDFKKWLQWTQHAPIAGHIQTRLIATWQDEGRWFLIPALCCLVPIFRRGGFRGGI